MFETAESSRIADAAASVVSILLSRGLTIAVAESLTGGLVAAELISVPGASGAVLGAVVAYNTELKRTLLGVDEQLLAERGPVGAEVAEQMARGVRTALAIGGRPADVGVSTTGVAGPGPQDGHVAGTVYIAIAVGEVVSSLRLELFGDRMAIRTGAVSELLVQLEVELNSG